MNKLVVATRKSALALTQARAFLATLKAAHPGLEIEELHVTTTGDRVQDRALSQIGGKGLFIKEIEEALLAKQADIAVHSLKDVPAELAPALTIGCIPMREDARDVLISHDGRPFAALAQAANVGTSSLRRIVQLAALRPDLEFQPLRGNVDTRLRRCQEGAYAAIVLAYAGLRRLGLGDRVSEVLDPSICIPAIGQGALAIEQRAGDERVFDLLRPLHHGQTALCVSAERGVMVAVEGSCQVPVAAHAVQSGDKLKVVCMLAEPDGSKLRRRELEVPVPTSESDAHRLGIELGKSLKAC